MVHVISIQFNDPNQRDTELLVKKTIEHDYKAKL